MLTCNTEMNSDVKLCMATVDVEPNNDEVSNIILLNSSGTNIDTFSGFPMDFDYSESSIETIESVDDRLKSKTTIVPMLTDITEETVYETDIFEESLKLNDGLITNNEYSECRELQEESDISNILMETVVSGSSESTVDSEMFENTTIVNSIMDEYVDNIHINNTKFNTDEICLINMNNKLDFTGGSNGFFNTTKIPNSTATETSDLITVSNNTYPVSNILENVPANNVVPSEEIDSVNVDLVSRTSNSLTSSISNAIEVSSANKKVLKPITVKNTLKFVPISMAPDNNKRSSAISISQATANFVTKVLVSQGKPRQSVCIGNSPSKNKPICILPNTSSDSSPLKITVAQAKQMGIQLPSITPFGTKTTKIVLSSVAPRLLKRVQSGAKPSTPTKILPAPLVSNSSTVSQQKIIIRPDGYVIKKNTIVPPQTGGQMIAFANLKAGTVSSNHNSPKKQVQYIKLINNVGSTNMPTVTTVTSKPKVAVVSSNPNVTKIDKDTPVIVASSSFTPLSLNHNMKNSKAGTSSNITVVPVGSSPAVVNPFRRMILPAVTKQKTASSQSVKDTNSITSSGNIVVLPEDILEKLTGELLSVPIKTKEDPTKIPDIRISQQREVVTEARTVPPLPSPVIPKSPPYQTPTFDAGNGLKSRKPCNCTRSQCLKLYCECFANGEFCNNCNCVSCHNNISHEENRLSAIRSCLDRNPQAFRPKIGKCLVGLNDRRHTKGCHCKRSGCLKNYCECYEAQIPCSENCKCIGCKNVDDMLFTTSCSKNSNSYDNSSHPCEFQSFTKTKLAAEINDAVGQSHVGNPRPAFSFIKDQVVEATCQCLLAQAEDVKRRNISVEDGKKYILEEFGRCLIQIIECAPEKYLPS